MKTKKIKQTPKGLRDMLFTELKAFREGKTSCAYARQVTRFSDSIVRTMCK